MEQAELKDIMDKAGFVITHSPREITHAICTIHGKIVAVTADDHRCCWIKNVKAPRRKQLGENMKTEKCCICDSPTGKAGMGEDSLYGENGDGPYCEECYEWKYGNPPNKPLNSDLGNLGGLA